MANLEDALKKLDRLTQEEARMALAEVLKITRNVRDEVKIADGKMENVGDKVDDLSGKIADMGGRVEDVGDKVEDVGDKVEDIGDKVEHIGDRVQCVDEKVQVVINGARGVSSQSLIPSNIYTFRRQASTRRSKGNKIPYPTDGKRHRRDQVFVAS